MLFNDVPMFKRQTAIIEHLEEDPFRASPFVLAASHWLYGLYSN